MSNSLICRGGGYRPAPDIILLKVKMHFRRHRKTNLLSIDDKRTIAYVLNECFDFTPKKIAEAYNWNPRTVRNYISIGRWNVKVYPTDRERAQNLYDYIIYNARYIH